MEGLPVSLQLQGQPVILIGEGTMAEAKARLLVRAGALIVDENAGRRARLAIVALSDRQEAEDAAARLKGKGILVNVADRPELCDFTLPAIVDRDPVTVAIATGGRSATLSKALRQWLEGMLPAKLGRVAEALHAARVPIAAQFPDPSARRAFLDDLLAGPLDPLSDHADPQATIAATLESIRGQPVEQRTEGVASGDSVDQITLRSADPDDLTLGQVRLFARADTIVHADGVPAAILNRARADAARIPGNAITQPPPPGRTLLVLWSQR